MERKSTSYSFFSPFMGLAYFVTHPFLWAVALVTILTLITLLLALFVIVLIKTWPHGQTGFDANLISVLKSFGYSSVALLVGFIVLMPVGVALGLDRMVRKILIHRGEACQDVGFFKSLYAGGIIFFKTFFWRLFWPIVSLVGVLFLGPIGIFISQLGLGHLAIIDAVDLTLALKGKNTNERLFYYKHHQMKIFCVGFSAALLGLMLSISFIGWVLWIPAVFCGVALWIHQEVPTL